MAPKTNKLEEISECFKNDKVLTLEIIANQNNKSCRTMQRYLNQLNSLTSYTHRGKYVTLPHIPNFDKNGLWFHSSIGFSMHGSSLDTILVLINKSKNGITKNELENILRIKIPRQMQILLEQNKLYRVKLNNTYLYMPKEIMNNRSEKIKIIAHRQTEQYHNQHLGLTDVIAVLKVVLMEAKIDMGRLKQLIIKYNLRLPVSKLEKIIINYHLSEKKTPLNY
ncbi:MAG: hypothetical protein GY870_01645 [archaeon]|nr:hypothetical protein [archaeon]